MEFKNIDLNYISTAEIENRKLFFSIFFVMPPSANYTADFCFTYPYNSLFVTPAQRFPAVVFFSHKNCGVGV